jgi:hypothetical protein
VLFSFAREAAGAAEHPAFPAPSVFGANDIAKPGRVTPREGSGVP